MAINNGRITGPTAKRDRDKLLFVSHQWYGSPTDTIFYSDNGLPSVRHSLDPVAEGELYVQRESGTQYATLFIAIDIGGALEWKVAGSTVGVIDSNTGKPWDPLAPFYNPLAS